MGISSDSIRVVGEGDYLSIIRIARTTWQHWARQHLVSAPESGLYGEELVIEGVVAAAFVAALELRPATSCWSATRERVIAVCMALPLTGSCRLDAIIDPHTLRVELASSAVELYTRTEPRASFTRHSFLIPLAGLTQEARQAFWTRARPHGELAADKRRRPARRGRSQTDGLAG